MKQMNLCKLIGQYAFIASNLHGWAMGNSIDEAATNCRKRTRRVARVFSMIPAGTIFKLTGVIYPDGAKFFTTKL